MADLNPHVLAVCADLPRGGGYRWPTDDPGAGGVLAPVVHRGVTLLRPSRPPASYCCGFTFEVLWRAWRRAGFDPPIDVLQARAMQRHWFCVLGRSGPVNALVPFGLGIEVDPADAQPGDFAQLWRANGSGHSVVVLGYDAGALHYLSTQPSTDGIGERTERPATLYVARAVAP